MRYILILFAYNSISLAQQKESTVSVSCYVNPELYIQAGVIAYVSDEAGNVSCYGRYISINNKSSNSFYYKRGDKWTTVQARHRAVILASHTSSNSLSIVKLHVRYSLDQAGDAADKIRLIAKMNAETDLVKAGKSKGNVLGEEKSAAAAAKSVPKKTAAAPAKTVKRTETKAAAKTGSSGKTVTSRTAQPSNRKSGGDAVTPLTSSIGLRIDFGTGPIGLGPNLKHKLNRNLFVDAAIVFFEEDRVGVVGQLEYNMPVKGARGLYWYIGIGPEFLFNNDDTAAGLVPAAGLEYKIPGAPLNFSLDWRPCFYLSPADHVDAGRFGLSFRVAF